MARFSPEVLFIPPGSQNLAGVARLTPSGTWDTGFYPAATGGDYPYVSCLAMPADGTLDATFNPGAGGDYPYVICLAVQSDGRILVGGDFTELGGQTRSGLGRLNADGTLDDTFNPGAGPPLVYSLAVQTNGMILAAGAFGTLGPDGVGCFGIGRLSNTELATQNLASDGSAITWLRGGASPEVWRTTFDYSTNGTDWLSLGAGTRIPGGWKVADLPALPAATLRARGFVASGEFNGSSGFVESTLDLSEIPPTILVSDGSLGFRTNQFGFHVVGVAGQTAVIEASTNLLHWTPLTSNTLGAGPLYFSDPSAANFPVRFYRARSQ